MLNDTELLRLREAVEREVGTSRMVLGARMGEIIRAEFPDLNIKAEYRSLRKFIENHLGSWLVIAGKHGQDVQYTLDLSKRMTTELDLRTPTGLISLADSDAHQVLPSNQTKLHTDEQLRQTIKMAIDAMTVEQLRQLVLPAGIMFDATNKVTHF